MVKITVKEFAEKYRVGNKGINLEDISNNLREALIRKKSGKKVQLLQGKSNLGYWKCN